MVLGLDDYIAANQGLNAAQAAASDVGASALTSSLIGGLGLTNPLSAIPSLLSLGLNLAGIDPLSSLIGAFSGRPKMEATQDIASSANNSDPVIALLGQGAQQLDSKGVPISSSKSSDTSSFGPYFQVASDIENLVRWGTTNPTPQQADLTATTLKNALTELGNPGQGTQTLQALQQAWQQAASSLTPQQIQQLFGQMSPTEQGIFKNTISQYNPNLANQVWGNQQTTPGSSSTPGSTPAPTYPNPEPALASQEGQYINQYKDYEKQYAGIQGQPGAPVPPAPPPPPGANATPQDEANYIQKYKDYENQYQNFQNQYANYVKSQPQGGPQAQPWRPDAQPQFIPFDQLMNFGNQQNQRPFTGWDNKQNIPRIQGQQGRPADCPPCLTTPGGQGGGTSTGGGGGNTTGGGGNTTTAGNQDLGNWLNLIGNIFSGDNPFQFRGQPGSNPNNPTNNGFIQLLQQLIGLQGGGTTTGPGSGTTTGTPGGRPIQPGQTAQPGQLQPGNIGDRGNLGGWWIGGRMGNIPNFTML